MFAESRVFIVDYGELTRWQGVDAGSVERVLPSHTNVLVIYALGKPDKRTGLYKAVSKHSREEVLSAPRDLVRWVMDETNHRQGTISRSAARALLARTGPDLQLLSTEIDKLLSYNAQITEESVTELATNSVQANVFQLVDAVVTGNTKRSLETASLLYTGASAFPYIIQMLARQYRYLFQIVFLKKQGFGASEISERLKLHSYAFEIMWKQANNLDVAKCAVALQNLAEADYKFKTGAYPAFALLHSLITKLAK